MLAGLADIAARGSRSSTMKMEVFAWLINWRPRAGHVNPIRRLWGEGWRGDDLDNFARIMKLEKQGYSLEQIRKTSMQL